MYRIQVAHIGDDDEARMQNGELHVGGVELRASDPRLARVLERNRTASEQGDEARLEIVDRDLENGGIKTQITTQPLGFESKLVLRNFLRLHIVRRFINIDRKSVV